MVDTTNIQPVTLEALTEAKINGSGVFDVLMQSVNSHLLREFNDGRISSSDYAEVYLGSMQSTIGQSIQFLLSKDKATLEAALVEAQVKQIEVQTRQVEAQILQTEAEVAQINANIELIGVQKELAELEKDRVDAQVRQIDADILQSEAQVRQIDEQIKQITANTALVETQEELAELEKGKVAKEVDILSEQLLNLAQERTNLEAVKLKTDAEVDLLNQKKVTEVAQTQDGAAGVIGSQLALYAAQKQGFTDDAKAKFVKAANDVYAIAKSNDPDAVQDPTNMISVLENMLSALNAS